MKDHFRKAIVSAVKERNAESEYLAEYNKGLKLISVEAYEERGVIVNDVWLDGEGNKGYMLRLLATFSFKPSAKGDNNRFKYEITIYSDGKIGAYFDGTYFEA